MKNYDEILKMTYLLPYENKAIIDTKSDVFGLALWTLQLASLKSAFKNAICECSEDGKVKKYFESILHFLENAFVNREITSSSSADVNDFCDAAQSLAENACAELLNEKFQEPGFLALDLLHGYIAALKSGVFWTFDIDDGDFL